MCHGGLAAKEASVGKMSVISLPPGRSCAFQPRAQSSRMLGSRAQRNVLRCGGQSVSLQFQSMITPHYCRSPNLSHALIIANVVSAGGRLEEVALDDAAPLAHPLAQLALDVLIGRLDLLGDCKIGN